MKAVVFGGSGFVGSSVADALARAGHETTVADIAPSPYLGDGQRFEQVDVTDLARVVEVVDGHDVLYNFAGQADIDGARAEPVASGRANVIGNLNLLEAARLARLRRFVFASTIYVYSESGSFYRVSKQACELYTEEYRREFGLDYTILRYGTLYGRRADRRNAVYGYLRQALDEHRIVAYGTGDEIREYIHVEDAARLSVEILADDFANQHVILAGEHRMHLRDLLTLIKEIVGGDIEIEFRAPGPEAVKSWHYTVTPYVFRPKIARKLVDRYALDIGQGLLDCLQAIYDEEHGPPEPEIVRVETRREDR